MFAAVGCMPWLEPPSCQSFSLSPALLISASLRILDRSPGPMVSPAWAGTTSSAAVRMAQVVVAASNPNRLEPEPLEDSDELLAGDARQMAHALIRTR